MIANASADVRELEDKLDRVTRAAHDGGVQGVLLATHHNIAWLTGGRSNRVDASREAGTSRLLVTADARRFVLANAIEMPRMLDEVLAGLEFEPVEYAWADDQDPAYAVRAARGMPLEDLRDAWGPARVLHHATEQAGIATTGPIPPYVSPLDDTRLQQLAPVARTLRERTI